MLFKKLRMKREIKKVIAKINDIRFMSQINKADRELIKKIRKSRLTYLSETKLTSIVLSLKHINKNNINGIVIEAGCALGGSSILISSFKRKKIKFQVFDVFEMIPPPTQEDDKQVHKRYDTIVNGKSCGLGDELYYGYEENLYDKVLQTFKKFNINLVNNNVNLVKGLVQETMSINEPVAFAHIDVDWYDPVKTCLKQIWPNLVSGGCIILDDYYVWGGCKKATDEYFLQRTDFSMEDKFGSMKVIKL